MVVDDGIKLRGEKVEELLSSDRYFGDGIDNKLEEVNTVS